MVPFSLGLRAGTDCLAAVGPCVFDTVFAMVFYLSCISTSQEPCGLAGVFLQWLIAFSFIVDHVPPGSSAYQDSDFTTCCWGQQRGNWIRICNKLNCGRTKVWYHITVFTSCAQTAPVILTYTANIHFDSFNICGTAAVSYTHLTLPTKRIV